MPAGLLRACSALCGMAVLLLAVWSLFSGGPDATGGRTGPAMATATTAAGLGTWLGLLVVGLSMPVLLVLGGRDDARLRWSYTGAALAAGMVALVLWVAGGGA